MFSQLSEGVGQLELGLYLGPQLLHLAPTLGVLPPTEQVVKVKG